MSSAVSDAAALDAARRLRDESRRVIAGLQTRYGEETGIKALKIKYNGVLGYHIDVPASQGDTLMGAPFSDTFIHRQTLANAVRFSTQELAELAGEIRELEDNHTSAVYRDRRGSMKPSSEYITMSTVTPGLAPDAMFTASPM